MFSWLPENISSFGQSLDDVMRLIWNIVFVWFIAAELILLYFLIRYRAKEGGRAHHQPGKTFKALAWVLIPVSVVLLLDIGIDIAQSSVWNEIKIKLPEDPDQVIQIDGKQFVWDFTVPGKDGKLGTKDDIKTVNQLTLPLNATVVFNLSATDVIHSFWVPQLRLKQDAVPGRVIKGWFKPIKAGTYDIACAEICGSGHGFMKGQLHILGTEDYQKWLAENSPQEEGKEP